MPPNVKTVPATPPAIVTAVVAILIKDPFKPVVGLVGAAGNLVGGLFSDRRLKKNIKHIGESPNGIKIYSFEYTNKNLGDGVYQGVMSDEIPKEAVVKHESGYDMVDYSKLDVEFKNLI